MNIEIDQSSLCTNGSSPVSVFSRQWNNNARMDALFSPFRDRSLNPVHYDAKLSLWKDAIEQLFESVNRVTMTDEQITKHFYRREKYPRCLDFVIDEMIKERLIFRNVDEVVQFDVMSNDDLRSGITSMLSSGLMSAASFVLYPLSWLNPANLWNSTGSSNTGFSPPRRGQDFKFKRTNLISVKVLKKLSERLVNSAESSSKPFLPLPKSKTASVIPFEYLKEYALKTGISALDFDIILDYLTKKGHAIVERVEDILVVKLSNSSITELSESERSCVLLMSGEAELEKRLQLLETKADAQMEAIRAHLRKGEKAPALRLLKRKKKIDEQKSLMEAQLDKVHILLAGLEQSHQNKSILQIYSTVSASLKSAVKEFNLSDVEDTMDEISDSIAEQNVITQTLSSSFKQQDICEEELERELDEICSNEEEKVMILPEVPSHSLGEIENVFEKEQFENTDLELENVVKELEAMNLLD